MIRIRSRLKLRRLTLPIGVGVVAAFGLLVAVSVRSAQNPASPNNVAVLSPSSAVNDQASPAAPTGKEERKKSNFDRAKTDAAELSALADQLRDELGKMNVNVLSLDVIQKTEQIEKMAKKIKGEANGRQG